MNSTRFDRLARRFASRRMSRRTAMAAGAAGIASTGLGATSPTASAVAATPVATSIGTPSDPHGDADTAQAHPEYLFAQPFDAGAWAPKAGEDGVYTLTLTGVAGQTTYFSDRPERDAGWRRPSRFSMVSDSAPRPPKRRPRRPERDGRE